MTLPERVIIAAKTLVELRVYLGSTKRRWTPEELIVTAQQIKNKKKKKEEKMSRHTWQEFIEDEARDYGDDISDIIVFPETVMWPRDKYSNEPKEDATPRHTLTVPFDAGFGIAEGPRFTAWGRDRVYFPAQYDGAEFIGSVSRNPNKEATDHVGGG